MKNKLAKIGIVAIAFLLTAPLAFADGTLVPVSTTITIGVPATVNVACSDNGGIADDGVSVPGMTDSQNNTGGHFWVVFSGTPTTLGTYTDNIYCIGSGHTTTNVFTLNVVSAPPIAVGTIFPDYTDKIGTIIETGIVDILGLLAAMIGLGILMGYVYRWLCSGDGPVYLSVDNHLMRKGGKRIF